MRLENPLAYRSCTVSWSRDSDLPQYEGESINTILVPGSADGVHAPLLWYTEIIGFVPDHTFESRVRVPLRAQYRSGHCRH